MGRPLAIALALCAAILVLLGTLTTNWWSYESDGWKQSMGLQEARFCNAEVCRSGPVGGLGNDELWVRAGTGSYAGGFVAGGLLLAAAAMLLLGRQPDLLVKTAIVAGASALVSAIIFVALVPEFPRMTVGYSMYAYLAGCVLGVSAGVVAVRQLPKPAAGEAQSS